jgi:hypothetical protein
LRVDRWECVWILNNDYFYSIFIIINQRVVIVLGARTNQFCIDVRPEGLGRRGEQINGVVGLHSFEVGYVVGLRFCGDAGRGFTMGEPTRSIWLGAHCSCC